MNTIAQKRCTKCKELKCASDFFGDKGSKDGKAGWCKNCTHSQLKKWRSEHPEKVKEQSTRAYYAHREDRIQRVIKWNKEHPEKSKAHIDKWHKEHPEKSREANRKSSSKYPDRKLAQKKKYRAEHPEKILEWVENRRARKNGNGGTISTKEWQELKEKYNFTCLCCKKENLKLTMDHIIPLALGGRHSIENLQPLCGSCNSMKSTKIIDYRPKE